MKADEFFSFVNLQSQILSESNITWGPCSGCKYKKDLLISIEREINDFLRRYFDNLTDCQMDILNVIYSVRQCGKDFKYSYIRDLPIFKKHAKIATVEQWYIKSKIIIFEDGEAFIMQYADCVKGKFIFQKISSIPNLYEPLELLNIICKLFEPLLQIDLGDAEETAFIHSEISKHIPFKPHVYMEYEETKIIEIWEHYIKKNQKNHTYIPRCHVYAIKKYIIDNLSIYENEYNEIPEWKPLLQNTLKQISTL